MVEVVVAQLLHPLGLHRQQKTVQNQHRVGVEVGEVEEAEDLGEKKCPVLLKQAPQILHPKIRSLE